MGKAYISTFAGVQFPSLWDGLFAWSEKVICRRKQETLVLLDTFRCAPLPGKTYSAGRARRIQCGDGIPGVAAALSFLGILTWYT